MRDTSLTGKADTTATRKQHAESNRLIFVPNQSSKRPQRSAHLPSAPGQGQLHPEMSPPSAADFLIVHIDCHFSLPTTLIFPHLHPSLPTLLHSDFMKLQRSVRTTKSSKDSLHNPPQTNQLILWSTRKRRLKVQTLITMTQTCLSLILNQRNFSIAEARDQTGQIIRKTLHAVRLLLLESCRNIHYSVPRPTLCHS